MHISSTHSSYFPCKILFIAAHIIGWSLKWNFLKWRLSSAWNETSACKAEQQVPSNSQPVISLCSKRDLQVHAQMLGGIVLFPKLPAPISIHHLVKLFGIEKYDARRQVQQHASIHAHVTHIVNTWDSYTSTQAHIHGGKTGLEVITPLKITQNRREANRWTLEVHKIFLQLWLNPVLNSMHSTDSQTQHANPKSVRIKSAQLMH